MDICPHENIYTIVLLGVVYLAHRMLLTRVKFWAKSLGRGNRVPKEQRTMVIIDENNEEAILKTLGGVIIAFAFLVILNLATQILGVYGFFR